MTPSTTTVGVSIVVPTHFRPVSLARLLSSVAELTYSSELLELIVVGGSEDPGRDVVNHFATSLPFCVSYCVVPGHFLRSASFKRNAGADKATGAVLGFTDDDCVVDTRWISAAIPFFEQPNVGGVEGAVQVPTPTNLSVSYKRTLLLTRPEGYRTCNMFYRREVFADCGGFDLSFPYYLEDTDLAYTVMERGFLIPYAEAAIVRHPVPPSDPFKLLSIASPVEQIPHLFSKHPKSRTKLTASIKVLNRSHYPYLALYAACVLLLLLSKPVALALFAFGLAGLVTAHLIHDFRGLAFSLREIAATALCQPIVPVLRLFYWFKGIALLRLGRLGA